MLRSFVLVSACLVCSVFSSATLNSPSLFETRLKAEIYASLGSFVDLNKMGVWMSYQSANLTATVSLGSPDGGHTEASSLDIVPAGSLAKPWMAVGVFRLVESGLIALDDPISPHVDPFLTKINGTTLEVAPLPFCMLVCPPPLLPHHHLPSSSFLSS